MSTGKKHIHHGRSTKGILDPDRILKELALKGNETLLDAGCGDGFISIAATKYLNERGRIYAIDIYDESINMLKQEIVRRGIKNIDAVVADLTVRTPLLDNSIDICILANVLHGFVENDETEPAMREIVRVLKPSSQLAVIEFKKPDFHKGLRPFNILKKILISFVGPQMKIRLSPEVTENLLKKYGFRGFRTAEVGWYHYMLIAEK